MSVTITAMRADSAPELQAQAAAERHQQEQGSSRAVKGLKTAYGHVEKLTTWTSAGPASYAAGPLADAARSWLNGPTPKTRPARSPVATKVGTVADQLGRAPTTSSRSRSIALAVGTGSRSRDMAVARPAMSV
jgi:hypothetical protein